MTSGEMRPSGSRNFAPMSRNVTSSRSSRLAMRRLTSSTLAARGVGLLAAREDGEQQDLRRRRSLVDRRADGLDAGGDLVGRVERDVVGADHQHHHLRRHALELAVLQAPEHVLRAIPPVAEIDDAAAGEEAVPLLDAGAAASDRLAAPEVRDRIAEHDDVRLARPHQRRRLAVARRPVVDAPVAVLRHRHERRRRARAWRVAHVHVATAPTGVPSAATARAFTV